jgi:hypothetical protein
VIDGTAASADRDVTVSGGSVNASDLDRSDGIHVGASTSSDRGPLRISQSGGPITVDAAPKGAVLVTGGGRIRVGRSAGTVSVSTGGGDIIVGPASGSVRAGTGAGDVTITIVDGDGRSHSVDVQTGKGSATIWLPSDLSARFDLETAYTEGHGRTRITSDFPLSQSTTDAWDDSEGTPRKYVRASGSAGGGDGLIHVKIVNGDIVVRRKN